MCIKLSRIRPHDGYLPFIGYHKFLFTTPNTTGHSGGTSCLCNNTYDKVIRSCKGATVNSMVVGSMPTRAIS